jgi:hypothetical protein
VSDASRSAQDEIQENMQMVQEAISKEATGGAAACMETVFD